MSPAYYDSNYLLKLQIAEAGSTHVRAHAATVLEIHTAQHARAEFASAAFRKVREGVATAADFQRLISQLRSDISSTTVVILPLTDSILDRIEFFFATAPATTWLRAADALHLATAAENGFTAIYSNDKHLLAAAPLFGLYGVNVIR
jgi:predicted nucleic acid-binding protein